MIFLGIIYLIFTAYVIVSIIKRYNRTLLLLWLGIITIVLLVNASFKDRLSNIKKQIDTYNKQIIEIKAEQYDIADKNNEKYKKNEDKIIDLTVKCNEAVSKYNGIIEEDRKKNIIFRWYFNVKEKEFYPLEVTTEYVAPDYYEG